MNKLCKPQSSDFPPVINTLRIFLMLITEWVVHIEFEVCIINSFNMIFAIIRSDGTLMSLVAENAVKRMYGSAI